MSPLQWLEFEPTCLQADGHLERCGGSECIAVTECASSTFSRAVLPDLSPSQHNYPKKIRYNSVPRKGKKLDPFSSTYICCGPGLKTGGGHFCHIRFNKPTGRNFSLYVPSRHIKSFSPKRLWTHSTARASKFSHFPQYWSGRGW